MAAPRLLLIDNYDSYTHNLAHLIGLANSAPPTVVTADAYPTLSALTQALGSFDGYILSPGPGTPLNDKDFPQLERDILSGSAPVFGVCLGHQALCAAYGMRIASAPAGPVHGAVATVTRAPVGHDCPLLTGLPHSFRAVRYHSLVATSPFNPVLLPTAWTTDIGPDGALHQVLMAVRHRTKPLFGVQFHPESIASEHGLRLATNFVNIVHAFHNSNRVHRPLTRNASSAPSPAPVSAAKYRTLVNHVRYLAVDSAELFVGLFGDDPEAFWLDSSNAVALGSEVSRCSTPDLPPDSPHDYTSEADTMQSEGAMNATREDTFRGRFSIMGACSGPLSEVISYNVKTHTVVIKNRAGPPVTLHETTIFDYLSSTLAARHAPQHPDLPINMNGGYVGFFGYEVKKDVEGVRENEHESGLPDAWFVFADRVLIVDHEEGSLYVVAVVRDGFQDDMAEATKWVEGISHFLERQSSKKACSDPVNELLGVRPSGIESEPHRPLLQFSPERSRKSYLEDIRQCLREITNGESYEVCLTNRLRTVIPGEGECDPLSIYLALRLVNPAPYAAFLRLSHQVAVCCASPERYLQIESNGIVTSKPIKGTLPRGRSLEEDDVLRSMLQNSEKDRRENLMIVDLVRNDLSRSCVVGSVHVPHLMRVESYATVHQLVSTVTGVLEKPGQTVTCIRGAYPMGSMTGAPKVRTMEIIDQVEHSARGIYSGSIGYLSLSGAADLNVVIRTAIIKGNMVEVGVGGAIVALSNPEAEYDEIILKGKAVMQAVAFQTTGRSEYIVLHEPNEKSPPCCSPNDEMRRLPHIELTSASCADM